MSLDEPTDRDYLTTARTRQSEREEQEKEARERELRSARELAARRRTQVRGAIAASVLLLVVAGAAGWFWWAASQARDEAELQRQKADSAAVVAQQERNQAERQLKKAQTTQSLFLGDLARQHRGAGDGPTAILLALEALPDSTAGIARPYVPEAELQLDGAWRDLRERLILNGHEGAVISAAFSPDGKRIVTASEDNTARLWDAATGKPIGEPLTGHAEGVVSAAFSPDSKRIVTASLGGALRLFLLA